MFDLGQLKTIKKSKRVGRGIGSGKGGHTATRGQKGQKSRKGYKRPRPGFEGGSMPLSRRIPKLRGFRRSALKLKVKNITLRLDELSQKFDNGEVVTKETLIEKGFSNAKSNIVFKILNNGDVTKKLIVQGINISQNAIEKIKKAGGEIKE